MRIPVPTSWPAGAGTGEAVGYLMARSVPVRELPAALVLIRQAAGWIPANPEHGEALDPARRWLVAAREQAHRLGPPADLASLLVLLADGTIRCESAARAVLVAAGAGEAGDPRVLSDFATWTGTALPYAPIPIGRRQNRPVFVYARQVSDLSAARVAAAQRMRNGVVATSGLLEDLLEDLHVAGIRLDPSHRVQEVKDILGLLGTQDWLWQRHDGRNPLAKTMKRIGALQGPIPLERIPAAVHRSIVPRRRSIEGEWPPPLDAVRAWAQTSRHWTLSSQDVLQASNPAAALTRSDQALLNVLRRDGSNLGWKELHEALVRAGLTSSTATATISRCPLIHHGPGGYALLDTD